MEKKDRHNYRFWGLLYNFPYTLFSFTPLCVFFLSNTVVVFISASTFESLGELLKNSDGWATFLVF